MHITTWTELNYTRIGAATLIEFSDENFEQIVEIRLASISMILKVKFYPTMKQTCLTSLLLPVFVFGKPVIDFNSQI